MKKLIAASLISLSILAGCEDKRIIPNPPITKGLVVEKRFIPASYMNLQLATNTTDRLNHFIMVPIPEMYVIVLGVTETSTAEKTHKFGFYQVSPILFSEIEQGKEIDVKGNDGFKPVMISQ